MACVIIREAGQPDRLFQINKNEIIIGRGEGVDLPLPHITVSREHAKIINLDGTFFITNITDQDNMLVNEAPRKRWELSNKDKIQLGKFTIVFFGNNLSPMEQFFEGKALDEYPLYSRSASGNKKDITFQMSPAQVKKMMDSGKLIRNARIVNEAAKQSWTPGDKGLTFGKKAQIPVDGWFTGGTCAEITWEGNDHKIKKLGGFTTLTVNGVKVKDEKFLNDGDVFAIGKTIFRYAVKK